MYNLVLRPKAVEMAKAAYSWYEEQRTGLGNEFIAELDRCFQRFTNNPQYYSRIHKDFRQIILKRFPYAVIYEIIKNEVVVLAIFHTKRNPKLKFKR